MRTVLEINDAAARNYEIFDRVHQFHDRREDNERARPLPEHPTERSDVGSTDEKKIRGFNLKYNLLCENLRSNKIEQKDMADVRVSLRSVNELLKTFDRLIIELDDVSAILSINVRTGEGELIERHKVHVKLSKYANELSMREDHLMNKEKPYPRHGWGFRHEVANDDKVIDNKRGRQESNCKYGNSCCNHQSFKCKIYECQNLDKRDNTGHQKGSYSEECSAYSRQHRINYKHL